MITVYNNTNCKLLDRDSGFNRFQIIKYMKMAQDVMNLVDYERPCLSRQIGVVIVDPKTDSVVSTGHNGPPDNTPRCDDPAYLRNVVWPQLTKQEKEKIASAWEVPGNSDGDWCDNFVCDNGGCGNCPRKLIGAPSGQRLELCSCAHGETNAIIKAQGKVAGCWMFCSCGVPCFDCAKLIINSRIDRCFVVDPEDPKKDYSGTSRWLFDKSNTELVLVSQFISPM